MSREHRRDGGSLSVRCSTRIVTGRKCKRMERGAAVARHATVYPCNCTSARGRTTTLLYQTNTPWRSGQVIFCVTPASRPLLCVTPSGLGTTLQTTHATAFRQTGAKNKIQTEGKHIHIMSRARRASSLPLPLSPQQPIIQRYLSYILTVCGSQHKTTTTTTAAKKMASLETNQRSCCLHIFIGRGSSRRSRLFVGLLLLMLASR